MTNVLAIALAAVLSVESRNGTDTGIGDLGRAIGPLQIHAVAVKEANRVETILSKRQGRLPRRWTLADRHNQEKSLQMCRITLEWHYRRGATDPVRLACKWRNPYSRCPEWHRSKIAKAVANKQKGN